MLHSVVYSFTYAPKYTIQVDTECPNAATDEVCMASPVLLMNVNKIIPSVQGWL